METYEEVKRLLLVYLERDIAAHERGDWETFGQGEFGSFLEGDGTDADALRLFLAEEFRIAWMNAAKKNWNSLGIERNNWPVIARQICQGLREDWDADRMQYNPVFNPSPRPPKIPFWRRLRWGKGKQDERA